MRMSQGRWLDVLCHVTKPRDVYVNERRMNVWAVVSNKQIGVCEISKRS